MHCETAHPIVVIGGEPFLIGDQHDAQEIHAAREQQAIGEDDESNSFEVSQLRLFDFAIQLRAVTELNGSFAVQARGALARGQESLRRTPLWSERLRGQTYQERPGSGAGSLYFDVTYRLQSTEQQEVERQWDDREYAELEQRRRLARTCEAQ